MCNVSKKWNDKGGRDAPTPSQSDFFHTVTRNATLISKYGTGLLIKSKVLIYILTLIDL